MSTITNDLIKENAPTEKWRFHIIRNLRVCARCISVDRESLTQCSCVTVSNHPEEGRFVRPKYRCKLQFCHLFICGLFLIYIYIHIDIFKLRGSLEPTAHLCPQEDPGFTVQASTKFNSYTNCLLLSRPSVNHRSG